MAGAYQQQFCVTFLDYVIEAFGVERDMAWYPEYALTQKTDQARGPVQRPAGPGLATPDMAVESALRHAIDHISLSRREAHF